MSIPASGLTRSTVSLASRLLLLETQLDGNEPQSDCPSSPAPQSPGIYRVQTRGWGGVGSVSSKDVPKSLRRSVEPKADRHVLVLEIAINGLGAPVDL